MVVVLVRSPSRFDCSMHELILLTFSVDFGFNKSLCLSSSYSLMGLLFRMCISTVPIIRSYFTTFYPK